MKTYFKVLFLIFSILTFNQNLFSFDSYEHEFLADKVKLHGLDSNKFILDNNLEITFGQLVMMPDYFAIANTPISIDLENQKKILDENVLKDRFLKTFYALSKGDKDIPEKIIGVINTEKEIIQKAIKEKKSPIEAYSKIGSKENLEFSYITGGSYLKVSDNNFDHFIDSTMNSAKQAFLTGYKIALDIAKKANKNSINDLKKAYCIYGFACHYFTDTFSTGHMRVPRFELWQQITGPFSKEISGFLSLCQHQEDGYHGLNVKNEFDSWKAYGDACLFEAPIDEKFIPIYAMQLGVENIYNAFIKEDFNQNIDIFEQYIPKPLDNNFSPLFKLDENKKLLRREDVSNRFCKTFTSNWWGLTTLIKLYWYHVDCADNNILSNQDLSRIKDFLNKVIPIDDDNLDHNDDFIKPHLEDVLNMPEVSDDNILNAFRYKNSSFPNEHKNTLKRVLKHLKEK